MIAILLLLLLVAGNTCTSFCYVVCPKQNIRHIISLQVHTTTADSYSEAANIRTQYGHDATIHYYQHLLQHNQLDTSAASFIAASSNSMSYLARIGWVYSQSNEGTDEEWEDDITKLHSMLEVSGYQHSVIRKHIFNLPTGIHEDEEDVDQYSLERYKNDYPFGPTYVSPLVAGQGLDMTKLIDVSSSDEMLPSLQCLATLFLLSSCVPKHIVTDSIIGGSDTLELLQRLGLVFIFDDRSKRKEDWVVPLVHLFPLSIPPPRYSHKYDDNSKHIVLMTDLHPNVLGMTSIASTSNDEHQFSKEEGSVMYIGPDSLSLVQHLHSSLPQYIEDGGESKKILDICTGSGVQALSTLAMLDMYEDDSNDSTAVALDINERALRYTSFNAILNGYKDKITTICADLLSGEASEVLLNNKKTQYDILLANPPFIPTPPARSDLPASSIRLEEKNNVSATPRYGLFSSGGASGEDCLCAIVQLAPSLLRTGGIVAIVSEFMNPPQVDVGEEEATCELTSKIKDWWGTHQSLDATGVLFTNEFAINSTTYSQRRAMNNDDEDVAVWTKHLTSHGIDSISPGLLIIKTGESMSSSKQLTLEHEFVPKTSLGSIWTPHNYLAVEFTQKILTSLFET